MQRVQNVVLQRSKFPIYPWRVPKFSQVLALAVVPLLTLTLAAPSLAAVGRKHRTTAPAGRAKKHTVAKKHIGPRGIEDARATEIQTALIKAGYLTGEPSGHWDSQSQGAMVKFQSDHGWQTKLVPDSRALIKLGLGPDNSTATSSTASNATPTPSNP
jgi:hypothetical protein